MPTFASTQYTHNILHTTNKPLTVVTWHLAQSTSTAAMYSTCKVHLLHLTATDTSGNGAIKSITTILLGYIIPWVF